MFVRRAKFRRRLAGEEAERFVGDLRRIVARAGVSGKQPEGPGVAGTDDAEVAVVQRGNAS